MEPRRKWADTDSEEELEDQPDDVIGENIITSLPTIESANKPVKAKKKKAKKAEPEEQIDPNLVTKIVKEAPKAENKNLRVDGTTASKKERKNQEMDELNKLLAELGTSEGQAANEGEEKKDEKTQQKSKKGKSNKKEIFESVRNEIAAKKEKSKNYQKKEKHNNY